MTNRPAKKMKPIIVGALVAFNEQTDAVWFEVLEIDGFMLTIREHETNYAKQYMDKSLVRQVR